jgi:transposase
MENEQKSKKRLYRKYDAAFKANAVAQIRQGRSVAELSSALGVSEGLLYKWKGQANSPSASEEELKRLRKALKKAQEENAILKKALSIFA